MKNLEKGNVLDFFKGKELVGQFEPFFNMSVFSGVIFDINWIYPRTSNNHHQDYSIFSRDSHPKPSFVTGILGGGVDRRYEVGEANFSFFFLGMRYFRS